MYTFKYIYASIRIYMTNLMSTEQSCGFTYFCVFFLLWHIYIYMWLTRFSCTHKYTFVAYVYMYTFHMHIYVYICTYTYDSFDQQREKSNAMIFWISNRSIHKEQSLEIDSRDINTQRGKTRLGSRTRRANTTHLYNPLRSLSKGKNK